MSEPLVLHALRNKRAELAGELKRLEFLMVKARTNLEHIDHTILLFDPTAKPATIRPRQKRSSPLRFRAGEFSRAVMAALRAAEVPLTVREITSRVAVSTGLDVSTTAAMSQAVASVRAALARPHEGVCCEKRGKEPMVWRVG
jgi:hypothetical protein